jgi:hypothetical protein
MNKMSEDMLNSLFDLFLKAVWSQGGDGCGYLVAGKHYAYEDLANAFEDELRNRGFMASYIREDFDAWTLFSDQSNENFIISQKVMRDSYKDIEIIL